MHLPGFDRPTDKGKVRFTKAADLAGFLGAVPFGFGLVPLIIFLYQQGAEILRFNIRGPVQNVAEGLGYVLVAAVALAPFARAMTRVDRRGWQRVLFAVIPGLVLGGFSIVVWYIGLLILVPAAALGLIFGLLTFWPSRPREGAAGRALAVLGMTPALTLLIVWIASAVLDADTHDVAAPPPPVSIGPPTP